MESTVSSLVPIGLLLVARSYGTAITGIAVLEVFHAYLHYRENQTMARREILGLVVKHQAFLCLLLYAVMEKTVMQQPAALEAIRLHEVVLGIVTMYFVSRTTRVFTRYQRWQEQSSHDLVTQSSPT